MFSSNICEIFEVINVAKTAIVVFTIVFPVKRTINNRRGFCNNSIIFFSFLNDFFFLSIEKKAASLPEKNADIIRRIIKAKTCKKILSNILIQANFFLGIYFQDYSL